MVCLDPNSSLVPTFPGRSCFISLYHVWKAGMKIILSLCLLNVTIVPGSESQADHRSKQNWLYLYHSSNASSGVCKQNPGWKVDQILDDSFAFPFAQTQKHSTRNSLKLFIYLCIYLWMWCRLFEQNQPEITGGLTSEQSLKFKWIHCISS